MSDYNKSLGLVEQPQNGKVEKQKRAKFYKFKVTSRYSSDRNDLAQIIICTDQDAVIKFGNEWTFKVKTRMNYSQLFTTLLYAEHKMVTCPKVDRIKPIWWF